MKQGMYRFPKQLGKLLINILETVAIKTRRGSPVDDRPSTDKLHHFGQKKKIYIYKKNYNNVTRDT